MVLVKEERISISYSQLFDKQ